MQKELRNVGVNLLFFHYLPPIKLMSRKIPGCSTRIGHNANRIVLLFCSSPWNSTFRLFEGILVFILSFFFVIMAGGLQGKVDVWISHLREHVNDGFYNFMGMISFIINSVMYEFICWRQTNQLYYDINRIPGLA